MPSHSPETQLASLHSVANSDSDSELQKAWHLLSLLISLGHPASPFELALQCTLFRATPDLIRSLCSLPNSPITLTNTHTTAFYVTVSPRGLVAFQQFLTNFNLIDAFVARFGGLVQGSAVSVEDVMMMLFGKKRKRNRMDSVEFTIDGDYLSVSPFSKRIRIDCAEEQIHRSEGISRSINSKCINPINMILQPNLLIEAATSELICEPGNGKEIEDEVNKSMIVEWKEQNRMIVSEVGEESALPIIILEKEDLSQEATVDQEDLKSREILDATLCKEDLKQTNTLTVLSASAKVTDCSIQTVGIVQETDHAKNQVITPTTIRLSVTEKHSSRSSAKLKLTFEDATSPKKESIRQSLEGSKAASTQKENRQVKRNIMATGVAEMPKQKHDSMPIKKGGKDLAPVSPIDQVKTKDLPYFDSYTVEEEEGSGGYGTVYRARRKIDGAIVAIKCPHANAHRHHIINELKMLERFGGKNFVIKYDSCLKYDNADCFVLEYVEHDRPEVLKREINILELRWYGYCLFRALASLHKQGIVHRDVKPGNFLFSRKGNKGYLIDFNLAMDLNQKYATTNKSKARNDASLKNVTVSNYRSDPPAKSRKIPNNKSLGAINQEAIKGSKATLEVKNLGKRAANRTKAQNELRGWKIIKTQGPDGSGITSAKDVTSTRTPSAERLREPLPCHGRKELINLLQEAMNSPNYEASSVPASRRKRIAAPQGKVDQRHIHLTPMPLLSTGNVTPGTCIINNKDGVPKKEGPCVGTKGFRAPEVLLRSPLQGPKVDIWSAGVTLLYLIIGRTPFYGDPEQNMKDIAKLRGSEALWEVSKLHDRQSSFPPELFKAENLPAISLFDWCIINSKKRDFIDLIPSSLIDLVDKCLTVNPRSRISAEDALKHEFFAPCHEGLRKQRLLRQGSSSNSSTNPPLHGKTIVNGIHVNQQG
ncbi:Protein kinase superfamily protein [Euphorbia peplus]|nr:Protein kinase superfamily protein [Euphorbia peplus]